MRSIVACTEEIDDLDAATEGSELPVFPKAQLRETYGMIRRLLAEFEYDRAASVLDSLGAYRLPDDERRLDELKRASDAFEWERLDELLK